MMRVPGLMVIMVAGIAQAEPPNWQVETTAGERPTAERCVVVSAEKRIDDGYATTPVRIEVSRDRVQVITESHIDPAYPDQGLQVDAYAPIEPDEPFPEHETTARFQEAFAQLLEQFKRGYELTVRLGFWPTWPMTETRSITFSLRGFTRAYETCTGA